MITGALLVNKETGFTSRQEVNYVSKLFGEKKVGHIGTLDPFADGLLIMLFGSATKIAPFIENLDKTYIATLKLGQKTDTADKEGSVIEEKSVPIFSVEQIKDVLSSFKGKQKQIPPRYSALKVNGKRAYELARDNEEFTLNERDIEIYDIQFLSQTAKDVFIFVARVSKGTYIRTLGENIAEKLGTVGHLIALTRVAIGPFSLENSHKSKDCKVSHLISISDMLSSFPSIDVDGLTARKALNGMRLTFNNVSDKLILVKDKDGIIAVYEKEVGHVYHCKRGLRWKLFVKSIQHHLNQ